MFKVFSEDNVDGQDTLFLERAYLFQHVERPHLSPSGAMLTFLGSS